MRYCQNCGTKITDDDQRFCSVCGGALPEVNDIEKLIPTEDVLFILEEIDGSMRMKSNRKGFQAWVIYKNRNVLSYVGYDDNTYSEIQTVCLDEKTFNKLYDILRDFKNSPDPGAVCDGLNYNMIFYDEDQEEYRRYAGADHLPYFKNLVSLIKNIPGLFFSPVSTVETLPIVTDKKTGKRKKIAAVWAGILGGCILFGALTFIFVRYIYPGDTKESQVRTSIGDSESSDSEDTDWDDREESFLLLSGEEMTEIKILDPQSALQAVTDIAGRMEQLCL